MNYKETNKNYVYFHINPLKNAVFYVGIGKKDRAYVKKGRSELWQRTVSKYGYIIDIVENNLSWNKAQEREKFYIKRFGRINMDTGKLVNFTDGGEGMNNPSEETRRKVGEKSRLQPRTKEWCNRISEALKEQVIPEDVRAKMSAAKKGKPSPRKGKHWMMEETKDKIRKSHLGKKLSHDSIIKREETKRINRLKLFGQLALIQI